MKSMLKLVLAGMMAAQFSVAAGIPNCWEDQPVGALVDGSFLVSITPSKLTKEQLLWALKELNNGQNLSAPSYPIIMDDYVVVNTEAVDYQVKKLPRRVLKANVTAQLQPVANLPGVTVSCNGIMRPAAM